MKFYFFELQVGIFFQFLFDKSHERDAYLQVLAINCVVVKVDHLLNWPLQSHKQSFLRVIIPFSTKSVTTKQSSRAI